MKERLILAHTTITITTMRITIMLPTKKNGMEEKVDGRKIMAPEKQVHHFRFPTKPIPIQMYQRKNL